LINSKWGARRRVGLSVALLAGVFASVGALSSPALAATPMTTTTKTTTFTLSCDTGIADGDVSVTTTQTYPTSVAPSTKIKIKWSSVTTVEGALASAAYAIAPNGTEQGTITVDNDLSSDGTPATKNIAGSSGLFEEGDITSGSSFNVYTPTTTGTMVNGTYTAKLKSGTAAGKDKISAQDDDANITIYNSSGSPVESTTADCSPVGTPAVIATVKVT
jgi:hypothetical protein